MPFVSIEMPDGGLVNRFIRRRYPAYRHVRSRAGLAALVRGAYHQERLHLVLLLFYGFASGYAAVQGQAGWCGLFIFTNVGYNLYPMWLQQYLRLRVAPKAP
ncbi:hypothetical protein JAO73_02670 [Hymenobacter sp. BT523]|uniref:glycosyl-4,4'-diaponeurosporenoate acyltransferase CrtO family protein n=1 Tax=Hymenobacter sp. BT523 TaxID=2795725 RepID=UPI0018EC1658|nr:hypothetical protein [Hymenobacter sp. BT523]MBJ6107899.1 hypothetical protein [Hymenobacter sp. BT523]